MSQEEKNVPVEQQRLGKRSRSRNMGSVTAPGELTPSTA